MQTSCSSAASSSTPLDGGTFEVFNPHDGSKLADVAEARRRRRPSGRPRHDGVFSQRGRMAAADRGRLLLKLADAIEADADELARLESLDTGHPIRDTSRPGRAADRGHVPLLRRHGRQGPGRRRAGRARGS